MRDHARALLALGPGAVLLKGGHLEGDESPDLLAVGAEEIWFEAPRIATANTHGTGCTLSSALATRLGAGVPLAQAVHEAKSYLTGAIAAAGRLSVGSGHGPVHHFHRWQKAEQ
jgi:hydroxymethylpyrimidine/phosphomethylpyrimidine kinase